MSRPKASKKHTRQAEVSEVASSQAFPAFQGTFDEQMRALFRAKRLAVGLSMQQLGEFLKIHWSTIRKWEAGITGACHPRHIKRVTKFLQGDFDEQMRVISRQDVFPKLQPVRRIPLAVDQCLERASQTYQLCHADYPELGNAFLVAIDQAIQDAIRAFLERLGGNEPISGRRR